MATYAIGDVQGCYRTLRRLLSATGIGAGDRVVLAGDLVNRGPLSLDVLRWAADQGDRVDAVLGNHDLHLLAVAAGLRRPRDEDTLDDVLSSPELPRLSRWLRERPFLVRLGAFLVVHAGLHPAHSIELAEVLARRAGERLSRGGTTALRALLERPPELWEEARDDDERLAVAVRAFTRIRACSPAGRFSPFSGRLEDLPRGRKAWFDLRGLRDAGTTVVFGHWAALGLKVGAGYVAIDTGCVWGNRLTAFRLEDLAVFQEPFAG